MKAESHSSSELLTALLESAVRNGTVLSRRDLRFGDYVVTLTAPHAARMPNGIECRIAVRPRDRVSIGRGRLTVGHFDISPGPEWDPVPVFGHIDTLPPGPEPALSAVGVLVTPTDLATEALLAGYVSGLVLLHGQRKRAMQVAMRGIERAGPVGATLLRHAVRGEVPEPVHDLLASRDASHLVGFSPAGMLWLRGLVSAGLPLEPIEARVAANWRTA